MSLMIYARIYARLKRTAMPMELWSLAISQPDFPSLSMALKFEAFVKRFLYNQRQICR